MPRFSRISWKSRDEAEPPRIESSSEAAKRRSSVRDPGRPETDVVLLGRPALEAVAGCGRAPERLAGAARGACVAGRAPEELDDAARGHVPGSGDDDVVVRIRGPVVGRDRAPGDGRDHRCAPDHRPPSGWPPNRLRDDVVDEVLRVVVDHRDLLEDDLALGVHVREDGVVDHADDHVERGLEPVVGHACVEQRRLPRRGGVQLAAEFVEDLRNLLRRVTGVPLKSRCSMKCDTPRGRLSRRASRFRSRNRARRSGRSAPARR